MISYYGFRCILSLNQNVKQVEEKELELLDKIKTLLGKQNQINYFYQDQMYLTSDNKKTLDTVKSESSNSH